MILWKETPWQGWLLACCLIALSCEDTRLLPDGADGAHDTEASTSLDGSSGSSQADGETDGRTTAADGADAVDGVSSATDGVSGVDASASADGVTLADGSDDSDVADMSDGVAGADMVDGADAVDGADGTDGPVVMAPLPPRLCQRTLEYDTFGQGAQAIALAGEFNGWSQEETLLADPDGDGVYQATLNTSGLAGSYAYKFVVDGEWVLDPKNPMRKHLGGIENSKLLVEDCTVPSLELESLETSANSITAVVAVRDGVSEEGLNPSTAILRHGTQVAAATEYDYDPVSQRFFVEIASPAPGKHSLTFNIENGAGAAKPLHIPVWIESTPFAWDDAVMYFAMTDRFRDALPEVGGPVACLPENDANWRGGDWAGITQKLEEGYFSTLGVNALWLTAVVDNPDTCMPGSLGKTYTSYHGYFPSAQTSPENRLGSLNDLKMLVEAAHAQGIRVLVDLVANHLHSSHPLVSEKSEEGWFNPLFQCGFEEAPLTCWFEQYLPDLNYEMDAAVEAMTDAAMWWVVEADLDGFRIDAVKHMHDNFLYTIRAKLERDINTEGGASFYTVGETYVGDWGGGTGPNELALKKYVNKDMLHGQFDFPMYWRILRVFAREEAPPSHVTDLLIQSDGYYGANAVMSRFLGNHDVPRFISHAAGDISDVWGNGAKELGWEAPPGAPLSSEPYRRLMVAWSFLFTVDGIPLIYYGDEIGLPGAGDPDNRRMMEWEGWSQNNEMVYSHVAALASVRREHPALRRGVTEVLYTDDSAMAYKRSHAGEEVIVVLNRSNAPTVVPLGLLELWSDLLAGDMYSGDVSLPAFGTLILTKS